MTSKFKIKLFRGGDEVDDMPSIREEDCLTEPLFDRPSFLGTINDIKVQYGKRLFEPGEDENSSSSVSSSSLSSSNSSSSSSNSDDFGFG